jgi:hypothetical protein
MFGMMEGWKNGISYRRSGMEGWNIDSGNSEIGRTLIRTMENLE